MKKIYIFILYIFFVVSAFAQLRSPEAFLGYPVGAHFTPHWKIMDYFRSVAAAAPAQVRLQTYGQTNEGRPLVVAFISSPANISRLEAIRTNNLKFASGQGDTANAPAIVWLSYNVHGNEASSSEAAMLTLYALADPANASTQAWLQNTVVVIDPCINPDGRDRYVNWYNSIAGKRYDPKPDAREHDEPWPGGRVNHYNFDLNRDWAWQTQVESQQRVALYSSWLPQVHVDFHEQGINSPYYFAPAAQPYHEVITPWQREFQNTIGRNHARYFDAQGWLYFTKEEFDLTYPAYGDTYPLYNGAIGMTYEQAGHGMAGLGILTRSGDTLTLTDRARHHFTTGLSTVEVAAQNAGRLVSEFRKFYRNAITGGVGKYKTYVIKYVPQDEERINELASLLDHNGIVYSKGRAASARGYHYATGRDEDFSIAPNDLVISSIQPKSALVKVLMEPSTLLVDTLAYDITAWSLPYAYGLNAYATVQRFDGSGNYTMQQHSNPAIASPYAYVVRWDGMNAVRLVSHLMQRGIKLRYSERPFDAGGISFDRGAVLILRTGNQYVAGLWDTVRAMADRYNVALTPVTSGFVDKGFDFGSSKVHSMRPRRVALLTGEGVNPSAAGEVWFYFDQVIDYPVTLINAKDAASINWSDYDVLIMPDGRYSILADKSSAEPLRTWINGGGQVIALENAVAQLSRLDWSIHSKKADTSDDAKDTYGALKKYEDRERDFIPNSVPGSIFKVELDRTHPLAFGYPGYYYTLKQDDQVYDFIKDGGWNVGVIKKDRQVAGFVGSKLQSRLQDGLLFGVQDLGRGTITYLADDVLFRSFWNNGKLMFANALFLVDGE